MQQKVTAKIGGNEISIETGKIAKLADGAVIVTCGDTIVLVSAVSAIKVKEGQDYFPLTVDYREKAAAVGRSCSAPTGRTIPTFSRSMAHPQRCLFRTFLLQARLARCALVALTASSLPTRRMTSAPRAISTLFT